MPPPIFCKARSTACADWQRRSAFAFLRHPTRHLVTQQYLPTLHVALHLPSISQARFAMPENNRPSVRIAPNNQVFDLPVIVAIEEGLFEQAGLDVGFSATHADREKDAV